MSERERKRPMYKGPEPRPRSAQRPEREILDEPVVRPVGETAKGPVTDDLADAKTVIFRRSESRTEPTLTFAQVRKLERAILALPDEEASAAEAYVALTQLIDDARAVGRARFDADGIKKKIESFEATMMHGTQHGLMAELDTLAATAEQKRQRENQAQFVSRAKILEARTTVEAERRRLEEALAVLAAYRPSGMMRAKEVEAVDALLQIGSFNTEQQKIIDAACTELEYARQHERGFPRGRAELDRGNAAEEALLSLSSSARGLTEEPARPVRIEERRKPQLPEREREAALAQSFDVTAHPRSEQTDFMQAGKKIEQAPAKIDAALTQIEQALQQPHGVWNIVEPVKVLVENERYIDYVFSQPRIKAIVRGLDAIMADAARKPGREEVFRAWMHLQRMAAAQPELPAKKPGLLDRIGAVLNRIFNGPPRKK